MTSSDGNVISVKAAGVESAVASSAEGETVMKCSLWISTRSATVCAALGGLVLSFMICASAHAADAARQIATAAQHAGYAADATAIGTAHAHLQHTINCLVGPQGDGFDAKQLNPCKEYGNGAIPDTDDPMKLKSLRAALRLAEEGLKSDDLDTAKKLGAQAAAEIKKTE
jgi:hypothetical protein